MACLFHKVVYIATSLSCGGNFYGVFIKTFGYCQVKQSMVKLSINI